MFQKIRQSVKNIASVFVSFTGWRPINTKEVYLFMVEDKGQLCSLEADVSNRKRNSSGDVLLEGVLHNQSNTSTAVLHAPVELINFSPD